jgi:cell wall-associated NlpC family hydrolase
MRRGAFFILVLALAWAGQVSAPGATNTPATAPAKQASLQPADLAEFDAQPAPIRTLIADALALTGQGLSYKYGSADPKNGGMDCSGTVNYVLLHEGVAGVPRDASGFYIWVRQPGLFQAVNSTDPGTFELAALKPGDLLFWTGTYSIERDPPITHVMLYLGTEKKTGKRVMFGASEGRRYGGASRYGVSVFDFTLPGFPPPKSYTSGTARFIGYAPIPGLPAKPAPGPGPETAPPASPPPLSPS